MSNNKMMDKNDKNKIKVLLGNLWLNWFYFLRFCIKESNKKSEFINNKILTRLFEKLIYAKLRNLKKLKIKKANDNNKKGEIDWNSCYEWYINIKINKHKDYKIECQNCSNIIKKLYSRDLENLIKNEYDLLKITILAIKMVDENIVEDDIVISTFILFLEKQVGLDATTILKNEEIEKNENDKAKISEIEEENNKNLIKIYKKAKSFSIVDAEHKKNKQILPDKRFKNKSLFMRNYLAKNQERNDYKFKFYVVNKLLINLDLLINTHWINLVVDFRNSLENIYDKEKNNILENDGNNIQSENIEFSKFNYIDPNLILEEDENLRLKSFVFPFEPIELEDLQWSFDELISFMFKNDSFSSKKINSKNSKLNITEDDIKHVESIDDDEISYYASKIASEVEEENVKNILITGEQLSGKSSILNSFLKNKNQNDYIKISFTNINNIEANDTLFEKSLVRQIMYQLDNNRFIGNILINKKKGKNRVILSVFLAIILSILIFPFALRLFYKIDLNFNSFIAQIKVNLLYNIIFLSLTLSFLFITIFTVLYLFQKNLWRFKSIKIKGNEVNLHNDSTFLDANVDVIVDIILQSNKKIIIFEDINKKNKENMENLFHKLFEMNSLLNLKTNDKKITFIYVVNSGVLDGQFKIRSFDNIIDIKNDFNEIDKSVISKKIVNKITTSQSKKISNTIFPQFDLIQSKEIEKIVDNYISYFLNWKEINIILNEVNNFESITKHLLVKKVLEDQSLLIDNISKLNHLLHLKRKDNLIKKSPILLNKKENPNNNEESKSNKKSKKDLLSLITNKEKICKSCGINEDEEKVNKYEYKNVYLDEFVNLWAGIESHLIFTSNNFNENKSFNLHKNGGKALIIHNKHNYKTDAEIDMISDYLVHGFSNYFNPYKRDKLVKNSLTRFTFFKYYFVYLIANKYLENHKINISLLDKKDIESFEDITRNIKVKNKYIEYMSGKVEIKNTFARMIIKDLLYLDEEIMLEKNFDQYDTNELDDLIKEKILKSFSNKKYLNKFKFILYFVFNYFNKNKKENENILDKLFNDKLNEKVQNAIESFVKKHSLRFLDEHNLNHKHNMTKSHDTQNMINKEAGTKFSEQIKNATKEKDSIYKLLEQLIYDGYIMNKPNSFVIPSKINYGVKNTNACFEIDHLFARKINASFLLRETKKCFSVDLSDVYEIFDTIDIKKSENKKDDYLQKLCDFYKKWYKVNNIKKPIYKLEKLDIDMNQKYSDIITK
ncbi:hypothetical protein JXZ92_03425 [Mycoplasma sp. CSL10137]|uniref:YobI family P-loop NTPase n=1 Tax=Mycoplasma sp. CSL10137 TaxID=2813824 RepID=UPI00197C3D6E|nr:hypothetical protein [Mycoplasma sp. CSL10137]MBN4083852.1 hypothetical protein [Mycoplasma sp. CSL10137]